MKKRTYIEVDHIEVGHSAFRFSGGETHVRIDDPEELRQRAYRGRPILIYCFAQTADDLMEAFMLTDAIRRVVHKTSKIGLVLPYAPYARQDRVCHEGEALAINALARLINAQDYDLVQIWDPHSDVTPAVINNSRIVTQVDIIRRMLDVKHLPEEVLKGYIVSPDGGAAKKVQALQKQLLFKGIIRAEKTRNPIDGEITGTQVLDIPDRESDLLIVDDICDGGRTFIELAKVLRPLTDGKIRLYVTHGIFSKGPEVFEGAIDEIYTPNLFNAEHAKHPLIKSL